MNVSITIIFFIILFILLNIKIEIENTFYNTRFDIKILFIKIKLNYKKITSKKVNNINIRNINYLLKHTKIKKINVIKNYKFYDIPYLYIGYINILRSILKNKFKSVENESYKVNINNRSDFDFSIIMKVKIIFIIIFILLNIFRRNKIGENKRYIKGELR